MTSMLASRLPSPSLPPHPAQIYYPLRIQHLQQSPCTEYQSILHHTSLRTIFFPPSSKDIALDTNHRDAVSSQISLALVTKFVHETLRRSGSSTEVLFTALCYLEALRPKIPHLVKLANEAKGAPGELKIDSRIPRISSCIDSLDVDIPVDESPKLPSPLLCPRRAFLATIILASKFTQERSYSNRAWAKLSGLPVDEIGRCERALGNALDWRLWVRWYDVQSIQLAREVYGS